MLYFKQELIKGIPLPWENAYESTQQYDFPYNLAKVLLSLKNFLRLSLEVVAGSQESPGNTDIFIISKALRNASLRGVLIPGSETE